MNERQVVECIERWLREKNFKITRSPAQRDDLRYWDVRAWKSNGLQWFIEAKGEDANTRVAFLTAIGQIVSRVLTEEVNQAKSHGIAVPDTKKWRNQVKRIPKWLKKKIRLYILLVGEDCRVRVITPAKDIPS